MCERSRDDKVFEIVAEQLVCAKEDVRIESRFMEDLHVDDLDIVQIVLSVEEKFGIQISEDQLNSVRTVGDLVRIVDLEVDGRAQLAKSHKDVSVHKKSEVRTYSVEHGGVRVTAQINERGLVSIQPANGKQGFIFNCSKPELIKRIAQIFDKIADMAMGTNGNGKG